MLCLTRKFSFCAVLFVILLMEVIVLRLNYQGMILIPSLLLPWQQGKGTAFRKLQRIILSKPDFTSNEACCILAQKVELLT